MKRKHDPKQGDSKKKVKKNTVTFESLKDSEIWEAEYKQFQDWVHDEILLSKDAYKSIQEQLKYVSPQTIKDDLRQIDTWSSEMAKQQNELNILKEEIHKLHALLDKKINKIQDVVDEKLNKYKEEFKSQQNNEQPASPKLLPFEETTETILQGAYTDLSQDLFHKILILFQQDCRVILAHQPSKVYVVLSGFTMTLSVCNKGKRKILKRRGFTEKRFGDDFLNIAKLYQKSLNEFMEDMQKIKMPEFLV
jgi:hypothetical protein